MTNTKALGLVQEVIRMMTGGMYVSSYESQIIEKLRDAENALVGQESVDIRFNVSRQDLIELVKRDDDADNYDLGPVEENTPTRILLVAVLQHHLYDSPDGPQLEGNFRLIEGSKQ